MKIAFFDTHEFEKNKFIEMNSYNHEISFFKTRLDSQTSILASGYECVCSFVNDKLDRATLTDLKKQGVKLIALRSAGFNHVDLVCARELGLKVVRVPEYSPYAVAEHAISLILCLNRKMHKAYNRVREGDFSLEGLTGFDLHQKTVGVVGTGKIGRVFIDILRGFGCNVLAYDIEESSSVKEGGAKYVGLDQLLRDSDIISLHVPLTAETDHLIDEEAFSKTKPGVMIINTGRGRLIDTTALIKSLKSGHIGYAGLDVYEEEEGVFFEDLSEDILQDDQLARLLTFSNVLLTSGLTD